MWWTAKAWSVTTAQKTLKKLEKSSWQSEWDVLEYKSSLRTERNAKRTGLYLVNWIMQRQTITPWTIKMDCLSVFRNEFITANENSWVYLLDKFIQNFDLSSFRSLDTIFWEFDPGSGRTLAACLTHASRTEFLRGLSGERVSNAWRTCLSVGDNSWKRLLIPHNVIWGHPRITKDLLLKDGFASD